MNKVLGNNFRLLRKAVCYFVGIACLSSCSDLLEVELPSTFIGKDVIFEDPALVESVLKNIYGDIRDSGFTDSAVLSILSGLYTDDLDLYGNSNTFNTFYTHQVLSDSDLIASAWSSAYKAIYECNGVIEGIDNSTSLTAEEKNQFKGEALFLRGYIHLLLVQLFGDVPYIDTTNYLDNIDVFRKSEIEVYQEIIRDLKDAITLLPLEDFSENGERIRANSVVAEAILARVYLYSMNWADAIMASTNVIDQFQGLEPDLDKVFLKNSPETIWQFKSGENGENTDEGAQFILTLPPIYLTSSVALSDNFINAFEANDLRKIHWVGLVNSFTGPEVWYFTYKYKERNNTGTSVEYPIQLRLAEQYLIRAEAYTQEGNIVFAQADLNTVRNRAGLPNITADTESTLLKAILDERRVELFSEQGHRWFDLKRTGQARQVLQPIKENWKDTDVLFPIPISEILLNPNLTQNDGY